MKAMRSSSGKRDWEREGRGYQDYGIDVGPDIVEDEGMFGNGYI